MKKALGILLALMAGLAGAFSAVPAAWAEGRPPAFGFPLDAAVFAKALTPGPDGNIWFTSDRVIGKVTPAGQVTEYPLTTPGTAGIVTAPDGNLWFTEGNGIGRATTAGEVTSFSLPGKSRPSAITMGPDGALWFTERLAGRIGRITTTGAITEFALAAESRPSGIVAGPDGNLWFSERGSGQIGRITPAGVIAEFRVPGAGVKPQSIARGPDGNLWFGDAAAPRIGRITPAGKVTMFSVPAVGGTHALTAGPDGRLWFASLFEVGAIDTDGVVSWPSCLAEGCPAPAAALAFAPDGALWVAAGVGHCPGLCGGGTAFTYALDPGGVGPYSLPPLTLALGPRLGSVRDRATSVTIACGEQAGCRGLVRLGFVYYRENERQLEVVARSHYDLGAGEAKRIPLRISRETIRSIQGYEVFPLVTAGPKGKIEAQRRFGFKVSSR